MSRNTSTSFALRQYVDSCSNPILPIKSNPNIIPIKTEDFPSLAKRPFYSVLDCNSTKSLLNHVNNKWEYELERNLEKIYLDKSNRYSFNPLHK